VDLPSIMLIEIFLKLSDGLPHLLLLCSGLPQLFQQLGPGGRWDARERGYTCCRDIEPTGKVKSQRECRPGRRQFLLNHITGTEIPKCVGVITGPINTERKVGLCWCEGSGSCPGERSACKKLSRRRGLEVGV